MVEKSTEKTEQKKNVKYEAFLKAMGDITKASAKKFKDNPLRQLVISPLPEIISEEGIETFSTGSLVLDSVLGGGFPKGRIIEISGAEGSGKTSIALTAAGNIQKQGGTVLYLDVEQAFDPVYATKLGVDVEKLGFAQPTYAEDVFGAIRALCASGTTDLIIVDSIPALMSASQSSDLEKAQVAPLPRIISKVMPELIALLNKTNTTIIFINQIRDNIGQLYGPKEVTPGGKALKFFCSQRIKVAKKTLVKEGDEVIGTEVRLKCLKNKVAAPYGEGVTVLTFAKGINRPAELALVAEDLDIIKKTGRTYRYTPTKRIGLEDGNVRKLQFPEGCSAVYEDDETIKITSLSAKACIDEIERNEPLAEALGEEIKAILKEKVSQGKMLSEEDLKD